MNTPVLMTTSSVVLGCGGLLGLFAPDNVVALLGVTPSAPLSVMVQLMGTLYFSLALMNWMVRNGTIGGIYARPISMANLAHCFSGSLVLGKHTVLSGVDLPGALLLAMYLTFAVCFYWLAFRTSGVPSHHTG